MLLQVTWFVLFSQFDLMIIELYAQIQNHKNNIGFWQQPLKINYVRVVS